MKSHYDVLSECLDKMPNYFSSNEFSAICQKNGLSKHYCSSGTLGDFLKRFCTQGTTKRMWSKKGIIVKEVNNTYNAYTEEEAINYLKKRGYKIYKPTTTFKEI